MWTTPRWKEGFLCACMVDDIGVYEGSDFSRMAFEIHSPIGKDQETLARSMLGDRWFGGGKWYYIQSGERVKVPAYLPVLECLASFCIG